MAETNMSKYVILGAVALGAVYLITRRSTGYVQPPASPYVAQQQLQQWAQTQPNPSVLQSVISNLTLDNVLDLWDRIFGKKEDDTYSGGGDGGGIFDGGGIWA